MKYAIGFVFGFLVMFYIQARGARSTIDIRDYGCGHFDPQTGAFT